MEQIVSSVIPVFAIVFVGYFAGRLGAFDQPQAAALNRFIFFFALPPLIFRIMATVPLSALDWRLVVAYLAGQVASVGVIVVLAVTVFRLTRAETLLAGFASGFSNHVFLVLPLVLWLLGEAGAVPVIIIITLDMVVIYGLTLVALEVVTGEAKGPADRLRLLFGAYGRNPQLAALVLGVLWAATGAPLPSAIESFTQLFGAAAAPCALFGLGAALSAVKLRENLTEPLTVIAAKLFLQPVVTFLAARAVGLDSQTTMIATLLAAAPTGANAFVFAQRFGVYVQRASTIVLVSTVIAVFTLSAIVAWGF